MNYLKDFQVYIRWILFISTIIFAIPFLYPSSYTLHYQWEAGSIAIFTAWFILLMLMQRYFHLNTLYILFFNNSNKVFTRLASMW
jgi:hypothetical protein